MAAEWNASVSGFYHLGAAFSDNDAQDGVGVLRDGEFHINAELVTDNGLKFFARIEVEAQTDGDQIDKNYGGVETSFGSLKFGGDDTAIATYHNAVISSPGSKIGYYDSDPITLDGDDVGAVAGGYQDAGAAYTDSASAGESFYVGAMYETGPLMVAGGYSNNDFNDTDVATGWVNYRLAPGVMATGGIEYADDSTQEDIGGIV